jgi:esterase/lipase superfamily enzyme
MTFVSLSRAAQAAAAVLLGLSLAGCLDTGLSTGSIGTGSRPAIDRTPVLLVATTRRTADDPERSPWFGSQRGRGLTVAEARLAAPDRSFTGRVASVVTGDWSIASVRRVEQGEAAPSAFAAAATGRDVLLYVHGYRETFASSAINAAQLSEGIRFPGATALFTWPSAASTFDYGYDRESALWSRDAFEDLLKALADSPSGGRVHIVAHSMGTLLTLETLRMLRASGGEAAMARIGAVVLAAPDIDFDLFARGLERLGPDAKKITVISSMNDRALAVSARLAGATRAGAAEREKLEALGVRVADASDYSGGFANVVSHDLFLSNQEVQQVVKRAIDRAG